MTQTQNDSSPTSTELALTHLTLVQQDPGGLAPSALAELQRLVGVVADLQASSHADSTIERYSRQWTRFAEWCSAHSLPSTLPVPIELLMLYVADWATKEPPPAHSTIVQALAAIDWVHASQRVAPPRSAELDKLRRGMRNRLGVAPKRKAAPLLLTHLLPLGHYLLSPTRAQVRDAMVIGLRSRGLSYGEIAALGLSDVAVIATEGFELRVADRGVTIPLGHEPWDLGATLAGWLELRGEWSGPLISRLTSDESVIEQPISVQTVRSIILKWAARANVELANGTVISADEAITLLQHVLTLVPSNVRNMACIWLLWAGALRSDELVHVRIKHLWFDERGMTLTIPRSKTDQTGKGMVAYVPRGDHLETDVVGAMERWIKVLRAAEANDEHFILCPIDRHENLCLFEVDPDGSQHPVPAVNGQTVTDMIRESLRAARIEGIDIDAFSSHSGKRGIATQLARSKADISEIAKVTRHKSLQTVKGYVEEEERKTTSALLNLDL